MSTPKLPIGDGDVPDKALEELLAAFATDPSPAGEEIDLDDPSIDELLGLTPPGGRVAAEDPDAAANGVGEGAPPTDAAESDVADGTPAAAAESGVDQVEDRADPAPASASSESDRITEAVAEVGPDGPPGPVTRDAPSPATNRRPIQIGGDDLPDPVYLDEEGEERLRGTSGRATEASVREERNTILIGDDEIEGSSGGIPIATGATMDPRLRARRIAVKRAVSRRRLKWIVLVVLLVVLVTSGLAVLGSSLFAIEADKISISGAHRIDQADLDAAVAELEGHPALLVDTGAIEEQLERSPWVAEARVATDFPHTASIEIHERIPIATYSGSDGRFRIIDVEGRVVEVLAGQPIEFMLVTGSAVNAERGDSVGPAFTHAAELVESLSPAVRSRTSSVDVSDTGELSLRFHAVPPAEGTLVVLGAPTNLLDKLTRLEALLKNSDVTGCSRIDVTTPEIGVDRDCPG